MLTSESFRQPYPGLRPFECEEADLFFGREDHVDALLERLSHSHVVAVVGESGAGKSSLVRAGLLPALEAGFVVEAGSDWRVALMRPGGAPLGALADALLAPGVLSEAGGAPCQEFALAELRRGPLGLVQLIRDAHFDGHCNLLIVADQFEELFRYCREPAQKDQANMFVELLLHASRQRHTPIFVVMTMRSDFVGDCARFRGLPETLNDNQYLTPRLTRDQIAEAIRAPARVCGGSVEDALVDELCNAAGDDPDQLPLLQHLLMRVWARAVEASSGRPRLTRQLARELGGLHSALNDHAGQIYRSLPDDEQRAIARAMFRCLTDPNSQRRDLRRDALVSEVAAVAAVPVDTTIVVADQFRAIGRHLLMPPPPVSLAADSRLDISHESLIRQWSALTEWAREESTNAREFGQLREEAQREREGTGELLSGRNLARALDWIRHAEPTAAWAERYASAVELDSTLAFIRKSEADEQRRKDEGARAAAREAAARRNSYYTRISLAALALACAVAIAIFTLWRVAVTERARAEARRVEAVAQQNEAKKQRALAEEQRDRAEEQTNLASNFSDELALRNTALARAQAQAHSSQLTANARLQMAEDPALAVLLAREAARDHAEEDRASGERALQVLRGAIAGHVPSIEAPFPVARSRNYLPGTDKRQWLDYSLEASSLSSRGHLAIMASGNDAKIWSTTSGQTVRTLRGHRGVVGSAIFSPNGDLAATTSADNTARVWDVATGKLLGELPHKKMVNGTVFNRDGTLVVSLGDEGVAKVWSVGDYRAPRCSLTHAGNFIAASFSQDQKFLATVTHLNYRWSAQIWDVARDRCPRVDGVPRLEESRDIKWASFSDHGPWLGLLNVNGTVTVLSTTDWAETGRFVPDVPYNSAGTGAGSTNDEPRRSRESLPPSLAWSHDGRHVAMAGGDGTVYVAPIGKPGPRLALRGHSGSVTSISFQPADEMLLTTSTDRTARLWRLAGYNRVTEHLVLRGHRETIGSGAFSRDGSEVITASDDGRARAWKPLFALREMVLPGLRAASYAADGKNIVVAGADTSQTSGALWVSDLSAITLTGERNASPVRNLSATSFVSPTIVVERGGFGMHVRDLRDPAKVVPLPESEDAGRILTVSPNGRFLFATRPGKGQDGFRMWDLSTMPARAALSTPSTTYGACVPKAVANDGRVAWYCAGRDVVVLPRPGRTAPVEILVKDDRVVESARFGSQGRWLAVTLDDHSVEVFDSFTGTHVAILRGHDGPIRGTAFSRDDRLLATAGADLTARVWDLASGAGVAVLPVGAMPRAADLSFSPDGRSLLVVSPGRLLALRCYACGDAATLLDEVRRRKIDRPLSSQEERDFGVASAELNADHAPRAGHPHSASDRAAVTSSRNRPESLQLPAPQTAPRGGAR